MALVDRLALTWEAVRRVEVEVAGAAQQLPEVPLLREVVEHPGQVLARVVEDGEAAELLRPQADSAPVHPQRPALHAVAVARPAAAEVAGEVVVGAQLRTPSSLRALSSIRMQRWLPRTASTRS